MKSRKEGKAMMKKFRKILIISMGSLIGLCLLLTTISAIANRGLPQSSPVVETLSEADKTRLAETIHIREQLGDAVFPGWGQADIPAIIYNEEYVFLISFPDPPDGWVKVPAGIQRGNAWELMADDSFLGKPYYRQRLVEPKVSPEAFTVMVGDRWVSSMPTLDWFKISLVDQIQDDLPSFVAPIFPYQLFVGQLVSGTDQYITLSAHETFHSFQGMTTPDKFADAELINQYEDQYPWDDQSLQADWKTELDFLADALRSNDPNQTLELVRQFLALRAARRESANLSPELIAYEQHREWLEGLARYAELEIWRRAFISSYVPLSETNTLNDFKNYTGFESRWSRELDQISRMANDVGDGRFYYTGMAQAYLLDQLMPDWKTHIFDDDIWLDDLLNTATQSINSGD
jgi:hypothetical protein